MVTWDTVDWSTWGGEAVVVADPNEPKVAEVARIILPRPAVVEVAWRYLGPSLGATVRVWVGVSRLAVPLEYPAPQPIQTLAFPARELRVELVVDPGPPAQHRLASWAAPYVL